MIRLTMIYFINNVNSRSVGGRTEGTKQNGDVKITPLCPLSTLRSGE